MSQHVIITSACLVAVLLSGCSVLPQKYRLAAADLSDAPNPRPDDQSKAVHLLVQESQKKCSAFLNSMFAETAGSGVVLNTLGTAASALATVFTATAVTHSLSAASTIFTGTKSSISSEYLNALTISHVTQAIQTNYSADIQKYLVVLNAKPPEKIDYYAERDYIQSYHNECSLASAEGTLGSLGTANAPTLETVETSFAYTIPKNATLTGVVQDLVTKFNLDAGFKAAKVTAAVVPAKTGTIALTTTFQLAVTVAPADPKKPATTTATIDTTVAPETLTIGGLLQVGDIISVTGKAPQSVTGKPEPEPAAVGAAVAPATPAAPVEPMAGIAGRPAGGSSPTVQ
jgi:hypothetical protein